MNDGPIVRRISFDIHGEFITQLAREWFYTGEKSHEKVIEILMDSMTGTDTPEAQIRRYAEDILLGRAALKGSTAAGTYHLETYEPGEEEQMPQSMNIWKEVERRKKAEKDLRRMIERWDVAMDHISESTQREIRKELGEETAEDRQQDALDSFMARMMDKEDHTTEDYGWLEPDGTFHAVEWGNHQEWANDYLDKNLTQEERFAAMVEINASGMVRRTIWSEEDGCFCTIRSRESQFQQGTSPESTQRHRKSSCMTITWKETAKRRRTQYGRTNENR